MGKKYLLYIHDERFGLEPEKSNLVNLLLARHYGYFKPGTMVENLPDEDQELHKDVIVGNADLRTKLDEIVKEKDVPLCKDHGIPLTALGKCLQKNCKYN